MCKYEYIYANFIPLQLLSALVSMSVLSCLFNCYCFLWCRTVCNNGETVNKRVHHTTDTRSVLLKHAALTWPAGGAKRSEILPIKAVMRNKLIKKKVTWLSWMTTTATAESRDYRYLTPRGCEQVCCRGIYRGLLNRFTAFWGKSDIVIMFDIIKRQLCTYV